MGRRQRLGKWGEQVAEEFFTSLGYKILSRNFRTPYGEIDLIVEVDFQSVKTIVFVEVKTRTSRSFGTPEEAVNARKKDHLLASIQFYMQNFPAEANWRIDVIAIEQYKPGKKPEIIHFENAVSE
jgi:putative endonuclease